LPVGVCGAKKPCNDDMCAYLLENETENSLETLRNP
jgi:hypothetical protein